MALKKEKFSLKKLTQHSKEIKYNKAAYLEKYVVSNQPLISMLIVGCGMKTFFECNIVQKHITNHIKFLKSAIAYKSLNNMLSQTLRSSGRNERFSIPNT